MLFSFLKCIPPIAKEEKSFELRRKMFHSLGIIFPFIALIFDKKLVLLSSVLVTLAFVIIDYNKLFLKIRVFKMNSIFFKLLRQKEMNSGELCGLSWLLIGYTIVISSCDKYLVAIALTVLVVCDAMASLIGKNFGRISLCGKSLEGFVAYIVFGVVVLLFYYHFLKDVNVNIIYLFVSLIVSAFAELTAKRINIDDNFAIPVSFCFTYKILLLLCS